jgi:hypothetical protein
MEIIDLNGEGEWSHVRVCERYAAYCLSLQINVSELHPLEHTEGEKKWICPILDRVIEGIVATDPACIALGIDLVEEDQHLPFGRRLKTNTARALRRAVLSTAQQARLRKRLVPMLIAGIIPYEFREYSKLLRTVGVAEYWPELHACIPRDNPFAMRFYSALVQNDPAANLTSPNDGTKMPER